VRITALLFCAAGFYALACTPAQDSGSDFNRKAMLTFYADSLIIPAFDSLAVSVSALETAVNGLSTPPTAPEVETARLRWVAAYTHWQHANAYNFGPAGEAGLTRSLAEEIGTWPVNRTSVEQRIAANQTQFTDFARDTRGLQTAEYLLFGNRESASVIADSLGKSTRKAYLLAVIQHAKARISAVQSGWNAGYRTSFVENDGTDAGSSASVLYNEFVKSYEGLKNFKAGLPLGLQAGQNSTEPDRVEALFSGKSLDFLELHLRALERIWSGGHENAPSFRAYLKTVPGGEILVSSTASQLNVIYSELLKTNRVTPFSQQIRESAAVFYPLHTELQRHTRFFKSEMSSLLGISITYASGDGD
jgi:predicted lipoprotein